MSSAPTNKLSSKLEQLQGTLGYHFSDVSLLEQALTHKSHGKPHNERLEFIGDAVLGYLIGVMLYRRDVNLREDALTLMRAKLVRGTSLAAMARSINLQPHLLLGSGERKSGGRERDSILADAFEAVIGAVHEDGGIEASQGVVERLFGEAVATLDADELKDPKTRLQEVLQGNGLSLPDYEVSDVSGADHARRYTVVCSLATGVSGRATASSRRAAEQAAALAVLEQLEANDER